jgi:hypothetical protein
MSSLIVPLFPLDSSAESGNTHGELPNILSQDPQSSA